LVHLSDWPSLLPAEAAAPTSRVNARRLPTGIGTRSKVPIERCPSENFSGDGTRGVVPNHRPAAHMRGVTTTAPMPTLTGRCAKGSKWCDKSGRFAEIRRRRQGSEADPPYGYGMSLRFLVQP
jgi:hypothetical protein